MHMDVNICIDVNAEVYILENPPPPIMRENLRKGGMEKKWRKM
jgi:hypothetical protein